MNVKWEGEVLSPLRATPLVIASLAYGGVFTSGWVSAIALLLIGLLGGYTLRSWWAVPLLAYGMLLGNVARLASRADVVSMALGADAETLRLLGKVGFGLLLAYVPLTLVLSLPVALGIWLARRSPRRALRDWAR